MIAQCDSVVVLIAVEKGNKWRDSVKGLTGRLFCAAASCSWWLHDAAVGSVRRRRNGTRGLGKTRVGEKIV